MREIPSGPGSAVSVHTMSLPWMAHYPLPLFSSACRRSSRREIPDLIDATDSFVRVNSEGSNRLPAVIFSTSDSIHCLNSRTIRTTTTETRIMRTINGVSENTPAIPINPVATESNPPRTTRKTTRFSSKIYHISFFFSIFSFGNHTRPPRCPLPREIIDRD